MAEVNLKAELREVSTKGALNQIRRDGFVPGIVYSHDMEPIIFTVSELSLKPIVYTTEMNLVNVKIGNKEPIKSILKNIQFDPLTDKIIHVDFQAITVGEAIQVQVPINFVGQAAGIKEGGVLYQNLNKFDVECLPKHIPQHLEVEITDLHIGDSIIVKDLKFENITILNPEDTNVVSITASREELAEGTDLVADDTEISEPEVITKGKSEE